MEEPLYTFTMDGLDPKQEVVRFEGVEEISRLYRFEITVPVGDPSLALLDAVGQPCVRTMQIGEAPRHVHGIGLD